jgi:ATPase subunit of ABC transporter with duplicated ATPase domains
MASHDRALLADTISETVELDRRTGRARHYRGGWTAYMREREAARDRARAEHEHARQRQEQLIAAERETRRGAAASLNRARARVHDNDKNSREWVTMRAEEMTGRARKMGVRGRRIEVPDAPWDPPLCGCSSRRPNGAGHGWSRSKGSSCDAGTGHSDRSTSPSPTANA